MIGLLHALVGDQDEAMDWLERAYEERVDWLPWAAAPGGFDPFIEASVEALRGNPRYQRLVERLAVPEAAEAEWMKPGVGVPARLSLGSGPAARSS